MTATTPPRVHCLPCSQCSKTRTAMARAPAVTVNRAASITPSLMIRRQLNFLHLSPRGVNLCLQAVDPCSQPLLRLTQAKIEVFLSDEVGVHDSHGPASGYQRQA